MGNPGEGQSTHDILVKPQYAFPKISVPFMVGVVPCTAVLCFRLVTEACENYDLIPCSHTMFSG